MGATSSASTCTCATDRWRARTTDLKIRSCAAVRGRAPRSARDHRHEDGSTAAGQRHGAGIVVLVNVNDLGSPLAELSARLEHPWNRRQETARGRGRPMTGSPREQSHQSCIALRQRILRIPADLSGKTLRHHGRSSTDDSACCKPYLTKENRKRSGCADTSMHDLARSRAGGETRPAAEVIRSPPNSPFSSSGSVREQGPGPRRGGGARSPYLRSMHLHAVRSIRHLSRLSATPLARRSHPHVPA